MASTYGNRVRITVFGQSHSAAVGVTVEGLPVGERVDTEALQAFLSRRAPGGELATSRRESDVADILCGLKDGRTCGAPLTAVIRNSDAHSGDYAAMENIPRPGHADYTAQVKHRGFQDKAGGGHFSGRLTAPLCIAGGICAQILARRGVELGAHVLQISDVRDESMDPVCVEAESLRALRAKQFPTLSDAAGEAMRSRILQAKAQGDSVGGIVECAAVGLPAGLGDPMFDGMENRIAAVLFGIPAVKGVEFGAGFAAAAMTGLTHNDAYFYQNGEVRTRTNHAGGILGGITSGMPLVFRVAFKPTPSVAAPQQSVDLCAKKEVTLSVGGRHDPCVVPRAVPCVEAAAAVALLDAWCEA